MLILMECEITPISGDVNFSRRSRDPRLVNSVANGSLQNLLPRLMSPLNKGADTADKSVVTSEYCTSKLASIFDTRNAIIVLNTLSQRSVEWRRRDTTFDLWRNQRIDQWLTSYYHTLVYRNFNIGKSLIFQLRRM